jgi:AGZA family xanthine/uracil permease-like MFS transporter
LSKPAEVVPGFLAILLMPVTGSITDGIVAGLFTYILFSFIDGVVNRRKKVNLEELEI